MLHTQIKLFYFFVLVLMVTSGVAYGDGKFYYVEKIPVDVPYQRALLIFEDGKETLILQSKYKTINVEDGFNRARRLLSSLGHFDETSIKELQHVSKCVADAIERYVRNYGKRVHPYKVHLLKIVIEIASFTFSQGV